MGVVSVLCGVKRSFESGRMAVTPALWDLVSFQN